MNDRTDRTDRGPLPPKLYFRIGEVAGLVGVEPHVLRYWEREFRSIRPTKSAKGQRVYSRRDVESLLRVRDLLYGQGFTIAGARRRLREKDDGAPEAAADAREASVPAVVPVAVVAPAHATDVMALAPHAERLPERVRGELEALKTEVEAWLSEPAGPPSRSRHIASLMPARFLFAPPFDWVKADVAAPPLREGSDVAVDHWSAWRAPDDGSAGARAVSACFGMDLPTWVDEATPVAIERLDATVSTVSLGLDPATAPGLREVRQLRTQVIAEQELARVGDVAARVVARTALGFASKAGGPRIDGCFVLCAPTSAGCELALSNATIVGFAPPPAASVLARSVAYGVHHPRVVAASVVSLFLLAGIVAVWTRPRPRTPRTRPREA